MIVIKGYQECKKYVDNLLYKMYMEYAITACIVEIRLKVSWPVLCGSKLDY